jgi:endonuclease/exonuclease/phosphatase family metal-dependent hydrolase
MRLLASGGSGRACLAALLALGACSGGGGDDDGGDAPRVPVKVMTRNLYLGSELLEIIATPKPEDIPVKAASFWSTVKASDFPARAKLLADEIATAAPDLVALQEVELYRIDSKSDFDLAAPVFNAREIAIDFLGLLKQELETRGAHYQSIEHALTDAEMPAAVEGGGLMDLRMTDQDVILVKMRDGLSFSNPVMKQYAAHLPLRIGGTMGVPVKLVRGFSSIAVTADGVSFTFVDSHLEVGGPGALVQQPQAGELAAALETMPGTLVLAGDFNSAADGMGTNSYAQLTRKLKDGWSQVRPGDPGYTCCTNLKSSEPWNGTMRIDLVLFRGLVRAQTAEIVGRDLAKRTPAGQWPSDHAGLVMTLGIAKPN